MEPHDPDAVWTVVVPVKDRARAKSRLSAAVADVRPELAAALALDTLDAVRAASRVGRVVVVTDDDELTAAPPRGVDVVVDPSRGLDLDTAVGAGVLAVPSGPVAVVAGDLPQLSPDELDHALAAALHHELGLVADADGTGTTLLAAHDPRRLTSAYGPGSAGRHRGLGHVDLVGPPWPGLRRDVDEPEHLVALRDAPSTGRRTAAVLRRVVPVSRAG